MNADRIPLLPCCPRCKDRAFEMLKTHAYCVTCNYEVIHSDELCVIPQWALDAVAQPKPKKAVELPRQARTPSLAVVP